MRAATWSPEFDLIDTIDAMLEEVKDKGFGTRDRKVVLRNLLASARGRLFLSFSRSCERQAAPDWFYAPCDKPRLHSSIAAEHLPSTGGVADHLC
jgi:hypothetical protein